MIFMLNTDSDKIFIRLFTFLSDFHLKIDIIQSETVRFFIITWILIFIVYLYNRACHTAFLFKCFFSLFTFLFLCIFFTF